MSIRKVNDLCKLLVQLKAFSLRVVDEFSEVVEPSKTVAKLKGL